MCHVQLSTNILKRITRETIFQRKNFILFFSSGVLSSESNKSFNQECQPPLILSLLYLQMMKSEF